MVSSFIKNFFINLIYIYQHTISYFLQPNCRFFPTCSQYSIEMLETYGIAKGFILIFKRIFRCHPIKLKY